MIRASPAQSASPIDHQSIAVRRPAVKDRTGDKDDDSPDDQASETALALPFATVLQGLQQAVAHVGTMDADKAAPSAKGDQKSETVRRPNDALKPGRAVPAGGVGASPTELPGEQPRVSGDWSQSDVPRLGSKPAVGDRRELPLSGDGAPDLASTETASGPTVEPCLTPPPVRPEIPDARHAAANELADSTAWRHPPVRRVGNPSSAPGRVSSTESEEGKAQPVLAEKQESAATDRRHGSSIRQTAPDDSSAITVSSGLPGGTSGVSAPGPAHGSAMNRPALSGRQTSNQAILPSPSPNGSAANSTSIATDDVNVTTAGGRTADERATRGDDAVSTATVLANLLALPNPSPNPSATPELSRLVPAQVLQQIATKLLSVGTTVVIRLDPPLLGNVVLRVVAGEGKRIRLHFQVEEPAVGDALAGSLDKLESALRAQGLTPEGLSIGLATAQTTGGSSGQSGSQSFVGQQSHSSPRTAHVTRRGPPAESPRLVRIGGGRYIDFLL